MQKCFGSIFFVSKLRLSLSVGQCCHPTVQVRVKSFQLITKLGQGYKFYLKRFPVRSCVFLLHGLAKSLQIGPVGQFCH